ncbi:MAG: flagellar hook capping FlgD N-terminal domain-containing protein [Acidobacteriota bacterium]
MNIQGYTPTISAPMQPQAASTNGSSGSSGSSGTGNSGLSANNLQATFLNLLVTELQNQDPTQPVDPTQMVGQMVSLNELDQLISINQTLTTMAGSAGGTSTTSGTGTQGSVVGNPVGAAVTNAGTATTPGTVFGTQPALTTTPVPGGLMNLYGNIGTANPTTRYATQGGR